MPKINVDALLDQFTSEALQPASGASGISKPTVSQPQGQPQPQRQWSPMQQGIFDAVRDRGLNLMVQARAGTGKTTTIVKAMDFAPGRSMFLAFNKSIADELREKVPERKDDVKTLNALGHGRWMEYSPRSTLEVGTGRTRKPSKLAQLLATQWGSEHPLVKEYGSAIQRCVSLAKAQAFGLPGSEYPDLTKWGSKPFEDIVDSFQLDIPIDVLPDCADMAAKLFQLSLQRLDIFDFDDQIYVPLWKGWRFNHYANVFVDEFQDLNPIQHYMLGVLHRQGSRLVGVGDDHQAIYGFRGALTDSMARAQKAFGMTVLPLSVSYRCAQRIIERAQRYCPDIQWREGAPEGQVWRRDDIAEDGEQLLSDPETFDDCLVLCRNNGPLFRAILRQIRARKPCRVLSNFLEGFQGFIKSFKQTETIKLLPRLDQWYERERSAAEAKGFDGKVAGLEDRYETARLLCEQYATVAEVLDMVHGLSQGTGGPTFATIHKAKGLEHENVYLLRPDLLPAFYARTPEQLQQEDNLTYVAITRAKQSFGYGVSEKRK